MCGITGIFHFKHPQAINSSTLEQMTDILSHRGPDDDGYYIKDGIGLGQRRLSIIDLEGGKQPVHNEDRSIWVVYNGEIFNYIELRAELEEKGHRFYTRSDTEVIVHAYEEYGLNFLEKFIGQFAIALWDEKKKQLILARDRVGIRPLFYSILNNDTILFGSEMKSIMKYPGFVREIDLKGLEQVYTFWVNIPPKTVFKNISELAPGNMLICSDKGIENKTYWKIKFPGANEYESHPIDFYKNRLSELLFDATTIRLRADVPVASYLSGGIDSSVITALVKKYHNNDLITFSVAFTDKNYDERRYQDEMVKFLKTDHHVVEATYQNISESFKDVVWLTEKPMIRTAPAPLFLLSKLVRDNNIKVVLTGEGADEVFGGYNIFKEDKIRRFWAKNPNSACRPLLLSKLYPYIQKESRQFGSFWQSFFKKNLTDVTNPFYSHLIRWENTSTINNYLNSDLHRTEEFDYADQLGGYLDPEMNNWHPLSRAQYLEMRLFMAGYLLSSQGDRMMMGNSIEGRFPYLDHRVIEFASAIPPYLKIRGLNEKYILKKTYQDLIPLGIIERNKQPYRAPIAPCFIGDQVDPVYKYLLSENKIKEYGYFDSGKIDRLFQKIVRFQGANISARDDMAVVAIISTQLLHYHFIENFN
jgi:asparagine synthase (glutamine-hydrolysing)